jgi:hypothetical protein
MLMEVTHKIRELYVVLVLLIKLVVTLQIWLILAAQHQVQQHYHVATHKELACTEVTSLCAVRLALERYSLKIQL